MALIENIGNLVGALMQPDKNQEGQELAKRADVDSNNFSKIASLGLPLLLQGINRNTQDSSGLESFNQALNQHQERNNYDNLSQFAQNVDIQDGDKILNHVLSGEKEKVSSGLADRLGIDGQTVTRVLAILAPIVMKYFADQKREKNLGAQDVQHENQNVLQDVIRQVQQQNGSSQSGLGMLGGLLGLGNDSNQKQKDSGLLGDVFNMFK